MPDPAAPGPVDDPSLVIDRRTELPGVAGLHAIVIGVSEYQYLNAEDDLPGEGLAALKKLESSALSAWSFANKLKELDAGQRLMRPLKTLRLLIAPSAKEMSAEPKLAQAGGTAPICQAINDALYNWQADVSRSRTEQAVFFFSGHGIRRLQSESILLASDFLQPKRAKLDSAFELMNVLGGMVPTNDMPDIGREQFYFIDACRDKPHALDQLDTTQTRKIFDPGLNELDDRAAPVFFATMPGGVAAGVPGEPTIFTKALLWALDNGAYDEIELEDKGSVWPATTNSIKTGLEVAQPVLRGKITPGGLFKDATFCFNKDPPCFPFAVDLKPGDLSPKIQKLELQNTNRTDVSVFALDAAAAHWSGKIWSGPHIVTIEGTDLPPPPPKQKTYTLNILTATPWGHTIGGQ